MVHNVPSLTVTRRLVLDFIMPGTRRTVHDIEHHQTATQATCS